MVSLLIGGIVVLGAVFVLGVLVGKKLAGTPRADHAPDLLTALDHKSDALERARAAPPLTFQEELTRPAAPRRRSLAFRSSRHRRRRLARPRRTVARVTAPAATPRRAPRPPRRRPRPTSKPASAAARRGRAGDHRRRDRGEAGAEARGGEEGRAGRASAPARVGGDPVRPAAAHPAPKVPEATSATGAFTLQLGASLNRDDAERQAARLREKGYAPYIVTAEVPGQGDLVPGADGELPHQGRRHPLPAGLQARDAGRSVRRVDTVSGTR